MKIIFNNSYISECLFNQTGPSVYGGDRSSGFIILPLRVDQKAKTYAEDVSNNTLNEYLKTMSVEMLVLNVKNNLQLKLHISAKLTFRYFVVLKQEVFYIIKHVVSVCLRIPSFFTLCMLSFILVMVDCWSKKKNLFYLHTFYFFEEILFEVD